MVKEDKHEGMKVRRKKDMRRARDKMRGVSNPGVTDRSGTGRKSRDSNSTDMLLLHHTCYYTGKEICVPQYKFSSQHAPCPS